MNYKKEEIREYFDNFISDQDADWIEDNKDDLHYHAFNTDYYIIGTYQAKEWLGNKVFDVIEHIREYEDWHFGEVTTDFSDPERVVNMYAYIIGEEIVADYVNNLEEVA